MKLFVKKKNRRIEKWLEECMNEYYYHAIRRREDRLSRRDAGACTRSGQEDIITSIWDDFWAIVHESSFCKIYTTLSMKCFVCVFRGVNIPII